jgi:exosortase
MALIVLAAFLNLLGIRGDFLLISAFSLLLFITGLILTYWGWERLKLLSFPVAFFLFALPLPYVLIQKVSLKLQFITSELVAVIWSFLGLPIRRYGVHLEFASFSLTVADACSGLRSIICIIALGTLMAYLANGHFLRRIFFPLIGVL